MSKPWRAISWMNFALKLPRSSPEAPGLPGREEAGLDELGERRRVLGLVRRVAEEQRRVRRQALLERRELREPRAVAEQMPSAARSGLTAIVITMSTRV